MKKITLITGIIFALGISNIKAQSGYINTYAGNGTAGYSGNGGAATSAEINAIITTCALDKSGNLYIAEYENQVVRKVSLTGIITQVAGYHGNFGWYGDGSPATSSGVAVQPMAVTLDRYGNLYIADQYDYVVRKVSTLGIISTVAGMGGASGYSGNGGAATSAELYSPTDIALDDSDNLYIADEYNYRIRKVDAKNQIITTFAGNGFNGWAGSGGVATSAEITVSNLGADTTHNILYFSDGNCRIGAINISTNIITTFAGNGTQGSSGDNGQATAAELYGPQGVTVDAQGNVYVADYGNAKVREIYYSSGIINTVAGQGTIGFMGDGGPATTALLWHPSGVAVDASGNIYINDDNNYRIRKVNSYTTGVNQEKTVTTGATVYPNPSNGSFTISLSNAGEKCNMDIYNIMGEKVLTQTLLNTKGNNLINISNQSSGIYFYKVIGEDGNLIADGRLIDIK